MSDANTAALEVEQTPLPLDADGQEMGFGGGIIAGTDAEVGLLADPQTLPRSISAAAPATKFEADREALAAMTPEERVERVRETVERTPRQREILYQTLLFFQDEHGYGEGEEFIASHKAYSARQMQAPRILIDILARAGAIDVAELDCDGQVVTEEMKGELRELGAPEEEIEDLVVDWRLSDSEAGRAFLEGYRPATRLERLAGRVPDQAWIYLDLLAFCREKRTLGDIIDHLPPSSLPTVDGDPTAPHIQPSTFIDRLGEAGGVAWEGGWLTTKEGEEFLATQNQ